MNADEIAKLIAILYKEKIKKVIFATGSGGVQDIERNLVPAIAAENISRILAGKDPKIKVEGGMQKKLIEAGEISKKIGEVVMTKIQDIAKSINIFFDSGTLVYSQSKTQIEKLGNDDFAIFDLVYKKNIESNYWKERDELEQLALKESHFILSTSKSYLGGFSLLTKELPTNQEINGLSLECFWSSVEDDELKKHILSQAFKVAENKLLFLYTKMDLVSLGFKKTERENTKKEALWIYESIEKPI